MRTRLRRSLTRAALAATTLALVGSGALVAPAQAGAASNQASGWLADQVDDGLVVSEYNLHDGNGWQQYTDYGLALDIYYSFLELDIKPAQRNRILNAIEPEAANYTTFAGGYGKLLTAVEAANRDPEAYSDENLVEGLEALVVTSGDEEGRAKDPGTDFSNTFGQAYVATALAGAGSDLADEATLFLIKQQCAFGYFREGMDSTDFTCDAGTSEERVPSVDATATAAIALAALAAAGPETVRDAAQESFDNAIAWLVGRQRANGAFVGNGVQNSNSTGLAASAFVLAGRTARAKQAARWVDDLRVTSKLVRNTDYKPRDLGAIAYTKAALVTGKADGITRGLRYEWRRATAQAAAPLALLG